MKKILFISPTGTLDNGAEISTTNLMIYLKQEGYEIHNIAPDNSHDSRKKYEAKMSLNDINMTFLPFLNWWWEASPATLHGNLKERSFFYQKYIYQIRDYIRHHDIDLVISNTANLFQGAVAAACENTMHFWLIHEFPVGEFAYYKEYLPLMEQLSDRIFAVEGALYNEIYQLINDKCKLSCFIPFSDIDSEELDNGEEVRIVSVGKINENKNQIELLKAYVELQRPDIPLVFIGGWDEKVKEQLYDIVQKEYLENVSFLGYQDNPWGHVTHQDICVFNSKSESFSLVCVEAILKGVPLIVSDNPGYRTVTTYFNTGQKYRLGDRKELVNHLHYYIDQFDSLKNKMLYDLNIAREKYTIINTSKNIIFEIENCKSNRKLLYPLKEIIGETDPDSNTWLIHNQYLTIYSSENDGVFSQERVKQIPLSAKNTISYHIERNECFLRFDLSERFGISVRAKLIHYNTGEEIPPISHNAFFDNMIYCFYDFDPQLVYDVTNYQGQVVQFDYELVGNYESNQAYLLDSVIKNYISKLNDNKREIASKTMEVETYKHELTTIYNSRRWRITSKFINFFRRNK